MSWQIIKMTGCLIVSPPYDIEKPGGETLPVMIADTMVTVKGTTGPESLLLPAKFNANDNALPPSQFVLRKLNIVGNSAVAMAGDGWAVEYLARGLPDYFAAQKNHMLPLEPLHSAAGDLRSRYGPSTVWVTGITMQPAPLPEAVGPARTYHALGEGPHIQTRLLGRCSAIGSGAEDLLRACVDFDEGVTWAGDPQSRAKLLVAQINADRLGHELTGSFEKSWGGYVEMAYFDPTADQWLRGPTTANLFLKAIFEAENNFRLGLVPYLIAYDPGKTCGRIISVSSRRWRFTVGGLHHWRRSSGR